MVINVYSQFLHSVSQDLDSSSSFVMDFNSWNILWELCFGLLAILIVVGNSLTILTFLKQNLRKRAHFLLISLAVADLLVGLLSVPLYIVANLDPFRHFYASLYADIFTGLTSVFTLAAISLERMYAVGWPFRHRTLPMRTYKFAIATPWIFAATVTIIRVLHDNHLVGYTVFQVVISVSPAAPSLVICSAYCVIWWKEKKRMDNQNQRIQRETKLAKTLFLITGASLSTWLPFQIIIIWPSLGRKIDPFGIWYIKLLQFSNSLVNVIIYPLRISEFKGALLRMLRGFVTPCNSETSRRSANPVLRTEDVNETAI